MRQKYWRLAREMREWALWPAVALAERRFERVGLLAQDPGSERVLFELIEWLARAQDNSRSNDGGIARDFSLIHGWPRRIQKRPDTLSRRCSRNDEAAESLHSEATGERLALEILRADLTLPKGLASVIERMEQTGNDIVSMVHCAATGVHRPFDQLTSRQWDWTMALNARAFFELVHGLLPRLGEGSAVVALSSAGAVRAVPAYTAIGTSKGALESLARHLAVELAPRGIRVNVLSPGSVATHAWDAFPDKEQRLADAVRRSPLGRLVTVDEVAFAAQFLCSPASTPIVGHTLVIDGGTRIVE